MVSPCTALSQINTPTRAIMIRVIVTVRVMSFPCFMMFKLNPSVWTCDCYDCHVCNQLCNYA